jgi:uncharacterized RDD family membrane protein YckC
MPEGLGVLRRLAALVYDSLLLTAVLMAASFVFLRVAGDATQSPTRYVFQAYLLLICAFYFIGFWLKGGQTLAMRTWRFKLVSASGDPVSPKQAIMRFSLAPIGLLLFWWAWLDRDGDFLHDRLAGTRLVRV